jgi:hypothetical protein
MPAFLPHLLACLLCLIWSACLPNIPDMPAFLPQLPACLLCLILSACLPNIPEMPAFLPQLPACLLCLILSACWPNIPDLPACLTRLPGTPKACMYARLHVRPPRLPCLPHQLFPTYPPCLPGMPPSASLQPVYLACLTSIHLPAQHSSFCLPHLPTCPPTHALPTYLSPSKILGG